MELHFDDTAYDTVFQADLAQSGVSAGDDREARVAARRAFVEMKQRFLRATDALQDRKGLWLREQVRRASDALDLWLLRGPVLRALSTGDATQRSLRAELYRCFDGLFPEAFGFEPGATLPVTMPAPWEALASEPRRCHVR